MLHLFTILYALTLVAAAPTKRATSVTISPGNNQGLCLTVRGITGSPQNGDPIQAVACGSGGRLGPDRWDISRGDGLVRLTGTNFCFDAGVNPRNNVALKLYTCYPGLTQQQWYYTDDNRIAITGGNQCLDLGPSGPQTYQCFTGNTNQVWITRDSNGPPPTSSSSSSSVAPSPSVSPPPTARGVRLHPYGDLSKCLALSVRAASNGVTLISAGCQSDPNFESLQRWEINRGDGLVRLAGTNFCLDAGTAPGPGVVGKIWQCYPGLSAQQWYYTNDNHIAITGGTQCLDGSTSVPVQQFCGPAAGQSWTTSS